MSELMDCGHNYGMRFEHWDGSVSVNCLACKKELGFLSLEEALEEAYRTKAHEDEAAGLSRFIDSLHRHPELADRLMTSLRELETHGPSCRCAACDEY